MLHTTVAEEREKRQKNTKQINRIGYAMFMMKVEVLSQHYFFSLSHNNRNGELYPGGAGDLVDISHLLGLS